MKGKLALVGVLALVASSLAAQTIHVEPPFEPAFPSSRALGDSIVASAQGFESLYTNPAGFAIGKPSLTLVSGAGGLSPMPTTAGLQNLGSAWADPASAPRLLGPSGFGATIAAGIGYAGSGLGLGLIIGGETWGSDYLNSQTTLAFVGGMAFPVGDHFFFGGAIRPMVRVEVPSLQAGDLFTFLRNPRSSGIDAQSLYGFGVALDLGGIAQYGPFSYGLAVTDIAGTRMYYAQDSLNALASSLLSGGGLPNGQTLSDAYTIPMQATAGLSYHPNLGRAASFFDPKLEVDYAYRFLPGDLLKVPTNTDLLDGIRAGVDLRLLSFFHLRAGYEYGRLSAGAGVQLPGLQIETELFERVAPSNISGPDQGASAGISIRF
ncbi:MAG TPA: hypothetical protein VMW69_09670 [Spirochaetia bacterium]|nr:hypothetical protein [Spirochaetia bacterium]